MEQTRIGQKSPLVGRTLAEASIPQETGLIVIALRKDDDRHGGRFVFNPVADTTLEQGDELIVLGTREQIHKLRSYVRT